MKKKPVHHALDVAILVMVAGIVGCITMTLNAIFPVIGDLVVAAAGASLVATFIGLCATIILSSCQGEDE